MASYTVNEMRKRISQVYDGPSWKYRVERMSDNQVIAIFYDFLEKDKFNKKKKLDVMQKILHPKDASRRKRTAQYHQISFDELGGCL